MDMSHDGGSFGGVWSVPTDHTWGLVALVVAPLLAWVVVCACQALALRRVGWAERIAARLSEMPTAARGALFASYVASLVHLVLVEPHWVEDRTRALLFVADALGFAVVAAWTYSMRPYWRAATLAVLASTVAGYAFYVLQGWEEVDLVGLVTTTLELATALFLLVPEPAAVGSQAPARRRTRERWVAGLALSLALLSVLGTNAIASATLPQEEAAPHGGTAEGHAGHGFFAKLGGGVGDDGHAMAGMVMPRGAPLSLPTSSPAGPVRWPYAMPRMGPGMRMIPATCTARPDGAQQRAAVRLVDATVAAVRPYEHLAAAEAAGYVPVTPTGRRIVHYVNPEVYRRASGVDPAAVPALVYVNTDHGAVLAAAMYLMPLGSRPAAPPQPGGCLTLWHVHTNLCFDSGVVVGTATRGACASGGVDVPTPPMMHVWLAPVPGGPLSPDPTDSAQVAAADRLPPLAHPNGTA